MPHQPRGYCASDPPPVVLSKRFDRCRHFKEIHDPGITVDLRWEDGRVSEARLTPRTPDAAGERTVYIDDAEIRVTLAPGRETALQRDPASGKYHFSTTPLD